MNPRINATHCAMLAVLVPRNGVPKKTTPVVDFSKYSYSRSRDALSSAYSMALVSKETIPKNVGLMYRGSLT